MLTVCRKLRVNHIRCSVLPPSILNSLLHHYITFCSHTKSKHRSSLAVAVAQVNYPSIMGTQPLGKGRTLTEKGKYSTLSRCVSSFIKTYGNVRHCSAFCGFAQNFISLLLLSCEGFDRMTEEWREVGWYNIGVGVEKLLCVTVSRVIFFNL